LAFNSPAVGYNALVILFLALNGWFAYWLLRSWSVPLLPALLAGLLLQSLPFMAQEMGVLQLIALFGLLWSLLFLSRFLALPSRPPAPPSTLPAVAPSASSPPRLLASSLGLAFGIAVTFFTCAYYGLFSLIFLPLAWLLQIRRAHFRLTFIGYMALIGLVATTLTGPMIWTQQQQLARYNLTRSTQTVENNSARPGYYGRFLDNNLLYGRLLGLKSGPGQRLFPGYGLLILAVLGLWSGPHRRIKLYLVLAALLAFGLSLGLQFDLADVLPVAPGQYKPYQWLRDYVPGLAQLRSPFRFAAMVQLHLALLAGFGLYNLGRWFKPRLTSIIITVSALAIVETLALPLLLQPLPNMSGPTAWQRWLNQRNESSNIVILPFAPTNKAADFELTTRWMLLNRHLHGRMLNGYSGFFPPDHARVRDLMLQFPTEAGLELLRQKGIDYVVVYHHLSGAPSAPAIQTYLPCIYLDTTENVAIYALK
jgi:hypothetical protein